MSAGSGPDNACSRTRLPCGQLSHLQARFCLDAFCTSSGFSHASCNASLARASPPRQVKAIRNLNGHSIGPYQIHAGKSVPIVRVRSSRSPGWLMADEIYMGSV